MNNDFKNSIDDSLNKTIAILRHEILRSQLYQKGYCNLVSIYYDFVKDLRFNHYYFNIRDSVRRKYK